MLQTINTLKEVLADEIFGESFLLIAHDKMGKHTDSLGPYFVTCKIKVSELKKLLAKEEPKKRDKNAVIPRRKK